MNKLLTSILLSFGMLPISTSAQYAAELAAVTALGTDPAMLAAPAVYGFNANPHTPIQGRY